MHVKGFDFLRTGDLKTCPVEAVYEHQLEDSKAEVALQYWPRRDGSLSPPSQITLFILGNPGLLNYYIPFLNSLHARLPESHALLSSSHIGHTPSLNAPSQVLDVHQQVKAKVELVSSLRSVLHDWIAEDESGQRPRLCLMGHSVGAWFMCEIMKKLKGDIYAGHMLFPTVAWIADSWNGRTLWPIFHRPLRPFLSLSAPLLGPILPFTSFPPTTISLLRSPETIRHALGLARSEMEQIREPDMEWFASQNKVEDKKGGLFGVWAAGNLDGWVGREGPMVQEALGGIGGDRVTLLEGIPHAFCLSDEHSRVVAQVVAGWINGTQIEASVRTKPTSLAETIVPI